MHKRKVSIWNQSTDINLFKLTIIRHFDCKIFIEIGKERLE